MPKLPSKTKRALEAVSASISLPPRANLLREAASLIELPRLLLKFPSLATQVRGKGQPVMVLPGFAIGDSATVLLRSYLRYLGYRARGWGLGVNRGDAEAIFPKLLEVLEKFFLERGEKVNLVGWSMGGYLSREAARERPDLVEQVIMLGTPVIGGPKYTRAAEWYRRRGYDLEEMEAKVEARNQVPLSIPLTAIYSRSDGVVAWEACMDHTSEQVEHVEVNTGHLGLGISPEVYKIIAQRLGKDNGSSTAKRSRKKNK